MKTFCALLLFISSWCITQGCTLLTNQCASKQFKSCQFTPSCRSLKTLNLANKQLTGSVPGQFKATYGVNLAGDADNGIPKVVLEKLYLQQNTLTGNMGILLTPTLKEVNFAGNPFTSTNQDLVDQPHTSLKILNLADTQQTTLNWIKDKLPNLENLNLANNQLTDGGISAISKLTKLTQLDLSGNSQITDLTSLVTLTNLKTLNVGNNAALKGQVDILTSGASPETKRSLIMGNKMKEIRAIAILNNATLATMQQAVDNKVKTLNLYNNNLEARLQQLEQKLRQLNSACFAGGASQGQGDGDNNVDLPPGNTFGPPGGARRLADCIPKPDAFVDTASAAGLITVATAMVAAVLVKF